MTRRPSPSALLLAAMGLVALLPFLVASLPSMTDLPGHIGRYRVMVGIDHSAALARFYAFEWKLTGNLGMDLMVYALSPWLDVETAARIAAASIAPLTIAGIAAVSRALHGRIQPSAVLAGCFVIGNPFLFGFVNYCLGFALALLVFAWWIALRPRRAARQLAMLLIPVLLVWLTHAMAWGVLGLLVAGFEGERLWRDRTRAALADAAIRCLAFVPPLVLTVAWRGDGAGELYSYGDELLSRKAMDWVVMLRGEDRLLDIGTPVIVALLVAALCWARALRADPRGTAGGLLLALACLLMPTTLFGSWAADERLAPGVVIVLLVSLRWIGSKRGALRLAALGLALFVVRTAAIARDWHRLDLGYRSNLRAFEHIPYGARVHTVVLQDTCRVFWQQTAYNHLASIAIARRDALVNTQWFLPGAALLRVIYPVDAELGHDPSQRIDAFHCAQPDFVQLHDRFAKVAADRWDYLWLLRTRGITTLWPGHRPIYADADSALYRVH